MGERLELPRLPRQRGDRKPLHGLRRLSIVLVALAAAALARAIAHFALGDAPHVQDEQAYWLQAHTLALGHLATPALFPRAAFTMWFVEDRWARFGIFPPGWPAVLAAGVLLRVPYWVNPLLHAATTAVVASTVGELADARWGHRDGSDRLRVLAAVVYGFSPQALLLAASLMSHTLVALTASLVLFAAARELQGRGSAPLALLAGAALGVAALTRPLCACAIGGAASAALAVSWRRSGGAGHLRRALAAALPFAAAIALLFAYNRELTGHATRFPQTAYFDEHLPPVDLPSFQYHPGCNELGIGPGHGCQNIMAGGAHSLANALSNSGDNLFAWLLLAGGGPLVFVAAAFAVRRAWGTRDAAPVAVLGLPAALVVALYALYWYSGTCYGARFYHAALPGLVALGAFGAGDLRPARARGAFVVAWLAWNAVALVAGARELAHDYWGTDARFRRLQDAWDGPPALVMVAFSREPAPVDPPFWTTRVFGPGDWRPYQRVGAALGLNAPALDGSVVFAKFHPALVGDLARRFPDRRLWLYVETPDASRDRLAPYAADPARHPDRRSRRPPDNFDGYEVE